MDVVELHERLVGRAFLHDDPDAYLAGVQDALEVINDDADSASAVQDPPHARGA